MKLFFLVLVFGVFLFGCAGPSANAPFGTGARENQATIQPKAQPVWAQGSFEVQTEPVEYFDGVQGFLAKPVSQGAYPGVVMIHEWLGLNDNIKEMAKRLAGHGYVVLAVDLFGSVATKPEGARVLVSGLDQERALENLKSAASFLKEQENVTRLASLGWCFGGGQSLKFSLSGQDLDATIIYYGSLETDPSKFESIDWPVLGVFGENDASIPVDTVRAFKASLNQNNTPNEVYVYPGVGHAFANPSNQGFAENETRDAWTKTLEFLEKSLKA